MTCLRASLCTVLLLLGASPSCGARSVIDETSSAGPVDSGDGPVPEALYVADSCVSNVDVENAVAALTPPDGDSIVVVEVFYDVECTGLGGDYVLARELEGSRTYWLGGHGCSFLGDPLPTAPYGVLRYTQTAALFQTEIGICIAFPGEPDGIESDSVTRAIATFATLEEAQDFASSLANP